MTRSHRLYGTVLALLSLIVPLAALGNTPGRATAPFEVVFETTAPYYEPNTLVVPAGVPVRWVNPTASPHSVRHDGCLTDGLCAFESIPVPPDSSFVIGPLPPGSYRYHCELHPIMRGTLIVVEAPDQLDGTISSVKSLR
ncbi:MAG: hypothetical protein HOP00_05935 [Nitrospira sp.]|nr:hypothetical protein [Nitrospira sp.]